MRRRQYVTYLGACVSVLLMLSSACGENRELEDLPEDTTTTTIIGQSPKGRETLPDTSESTLLIPDDSGDSPLSEALISYRACPALLDTLKEQALGFVDAYGMVEQGLGVIGMTSGLIFDDQAQLDEQLNSLDSDMAGDARFSTTNVQELGVDEPDIVKTDGERILVLAQGTLHYVAVRSQTPVAVSSLDLRQWERMELSDHEMFMSGSTVIVLSQSWGTGWQGEARAVIWQVDISDPLSPATTATLVVDGWVSAARLIGERLTVVVYNEPLDRVSFITPRDVVDDSQLDDAGEAAERLAVSTNQQVVMETELADWFPRYSITNYGADGVSDTGLLVDCDDVHIPPAFSGTGIITVLQADITVPMSVSEAAVASVVSGGGPVYASKDSLYVTTAQWIGESRPPGRSERDHEDWMARQVEAIRTRILHFDISGDDGPVYTASGSVRGRLLNQFSMSEHDGYLRVASTTVPNWSATRQGERKSQVDILQSEGGRLRSVGSVSGLGKGEDIYAVRFIGDVGYVVTFRQTDPLYTIDLSDPTSPTVEGELKILGYSAYLHPIGDGLLLGVGQDADARGATKGTQLSVFDVSDLSNPMRTHQFTLPNISGSEVEYDHHAFLYWPPTGTAVIPVDEWDYEAREPDPYASVFQIDTGVGGGITEVSRIQHRGRLAGGPPLHSAIRRSIVIDDTLYTVSAVGIEASDIATTDVMVWMPFPHSPHIVAFWPGGSTWGSKWLSGAEQAAREYGYEVVSHYSYDQASQDHLVASVLDESTGDPPVAYVWWPVDAVASDYAAGARESLRALAETGVPVIGTDWQWAPAEGTADWLVAFVRVDGTSEGMAVAELMVSARDYIVEQGKGVHGNNGTAAILQIWYPDQPARLSAMQSVLEAAGIKVLESVVMEAPLNDDAFYHVVENIVLDHGHIDVMYLPNPGSRGVEKALAANGHIIGEDIMIVTGTCYWGLDDLESGRLYGASLRSPFVDGKLAIQTVHDHINGELGSFTVHPPTDTVRSPVYTPGQDDIEAARLGGLTVEEVCGVDW